MFEEDRSFECEIEVAPLPQISRLVFGPRTNEFIWSSNERDNLGSSLTAWALISLWYGSFKDHFTGC